MSGQWLLVVVYVHIPYTGILLSLVQRVISLHSAGTMPANQAAGTNGINQTGTAASVWTPEFGTQPQRDSDTDGLIFKP